MPKIYPDEYKIMIVEEVNKLGSIGEVAKKYKLNYSLIYKWKKLNDENNNLNCIQQVDFQEINDELNKEKELDNNKIESLSNENLQLKELVLKKEIEIQKLKDVIRGLI